MKTRIVIAGGGFASLYAAMHLDKTLGRDTEVEVVLISRENFILFTPMLHEVAAGDPLPRRHCQSTSSHSSLWQGRRNRSGSNRR